MPEQEQQPDGAEFHVENEFESGDEQAVAPEASNETQPDSNLEGEGRYDEQKAATIGAAVLEKDRFNAEQDGGTDKFKAELASIDEDRQRVEEGDLSKKLPANTEIFIPADAETIRQVHYKYDSTEPEYVRELHAEDRQQRGYIEDKEKKLLRMQSERADELERARQRYDEFIEEREKYKQLAIESGEYDDDWAEGFEAGNMTFAEYLRKDSWNPQGNLQRETYPNLTSDYYNQFADLERSKAHNADYRRELAPLELQEIDKQREKQREKMRGYLNRQSDYYAELYELNPDRFAAMPTKEFMEHRDALAGLEQTRAEQERYEQGLAGVVDTLGKVLEQAADYEKSVKVGEYGDTRDGHQLWFDHQFLRNDYRVASMMNVFHGYRYKLSDIFWFNERSYGNRGEHMDGYIWDMIHGAEANNGGGYGLVHITPDERALWEDTEAYFDDYTKKRLDVTPRQLVEGFSAVFEKHRADAQAKLDEANAKLDEFKKQFAPQQEV